MKHDADAKLKIIEYLRQGRSKTEICSSFNISRQTLDNWIKRRERDGLAGLVDKSRAHKKHPQKTPVDDVQNIINLAYRHPLLGGTEIAKLIEPPHRPVSAQTVNGLLRKRGLATPDQRWLALERQFHSKPLMVGAGLPWSPFLLQRNPRYREWEFRGERPGEAVALGVRPLGSFKGIGEVYVCSVVDTFSCCASASLFVSRASIAPADVLDRARDFYDDFAWQISRIKLTTLRWPSLKQMDRLLKFLTEHGIEEGTKFDIETRKTWWKESKPKKSCGFTQHFVQMAKAGLFDLGDRRRSVTFSELQGEFDGWLSHYNETQELLGYPTMGKSPKQMIDAARAEANAATEKERLQQPF